MADTQLAYFIQNIPKAELHVHIEGTLEPELMFKLAERNGIKPGSMEFPFQSVQEVRDAYQFSNLQDFLNIYYQGANVLRTKRDFYDLAMAYFERAHEDNIRHAEIFFDPQTHTDRGVPYANVIGGLVRAAEEAERRFDITSSFIHCFLRHLPEAEAFTSFEMAKPYLRNDKCRLIGVGLDSSEFGHPPEKFKRVFAHAQEFSIAKKINLLFVAHAGEEGPPEYVCQAIDVLKVDRIDHGNRALESVSLTQRLVDKGMTLTVCPLSNLKLKGVKDMKDHPIPRMLQLGLKATINSDDPAYFGGYVVDNYRALADLGLISRDDCVALAKNSFTGSILPISHQQKLLAEIDAFAASNPVPSPTLSLGAKGMDHA